jgi:hypothetical protein
MSEDHRTKPRPAKSFILEDWDIVSFTDPTGALKLCLSGRAFGSTLPLGGEIVRTSAISRYYMDGNRLVIFTRSGSEYKLGMRDAPQAEDKRRLIRYLDQISSVDNNEFIRSGSDTQTNILGTQGSGSWDEKGSVAA